MKFGLFILMILGLFGCQNDKPDLAFGKSTTIVTNQVYESGTQLILPEPWEIKFKTTSKGQEDSKKIYFKDELVMLYWVNIPIQHDKKGFRTINSDTIIKNIPIIIEHMTNDTTHLLNIYELQDNEEYPYHFFSGSSNPKLSNIDLINKLYKYLLEDLINRHSNMK